MPFPGNDFEMFALFTRKGGLDVISNSNYFRFQSYYVLPVVNQKWGQFLQRALNKLKQNKLQFKMKTALLELRNLNLLK